MVAVRPLASSWPWSRRPPWWYFSEYTYHVSRQTPRRFFRVAIVSLLVSIFIIFSLTSTPPPPRPHHAPFETPLSNLIVHGEHVELLPDPAYPLEPFPDSPMHASEASSLSTSPGQPQPPWLVTVISPATDAARRMLIRSTWMRLYRDVPFTARFVVSNPGPMWTDNLRIENRTFGDLIVLDHLQEDDVTANTVKTLELYRWLIRQGHRYEFVSKMDTDLWFNARGFYDKYISKLLSNQTGNPQALVERTIIGELYYSARHDLVFPHGAMYTATWDMVELLASLQSRFNVITGEDMALAMLMLKGRETANFINFKGSEKFNYDDDDSRGDGTAWARRNTHTDATHHAIYGSDPIAVHQLKDEGMFLKVADCFDSNGIREMEPAGPERAPPFEVVWYDFLHIINMNVHWKSRFERIPEFLWSFGNGYWFCDGIWRLGHTRMGHIEDLEHF
ncbi:Galactosyltransferase [Geosmithia morbida]|uniref:Hexosyltransferase n=1 Tax=Geosmithia morbida TaxID=1094350 RepID=A0A9P5D2J4_9HYPO|nr:Galactosyltransferase [Geosmithia morbida]KAF4120875.1 Galactosyltransferase [Geosmithia morbida]